MIKFRGEKGGKPLFGFGISEGNVRKLARGEPILINLDEMGAEGKVLIFYGESERDLVDKVDHMIGAETDLKVHDDENY